MASGWAHEPVLGSCSCNISMSVAPWTTLLKPVIFSVFPAQCTGRCTPVAAVTGLRKVAYRIVFLQAFASAVTKTRSNACSQLNKRPGKGFLACLAFCLIAF